MEVRAVYKYARITAQKARLIADLVRGMNVEQALDSLTFSTKKSAVLFKKVLNSAISNAENNNGLDVDQLYIKTVYVDEAATMKRMRARAKGRGNKILKRTSHIILIVSDDKK